MKSTFLKLKFLKTTLVWTFLLGVIITSCGKKSSGPAPVPVDKTTLQATVTAAQTLNDKTVEGTKPGQYEAGSKAALTTALNSSKLVLTSSSSTQTAVN
nr:hypothetical protein [Bacteroidota bacterium]